MILLILVMAFLAAVYAGSPPHTRSYSVPVIPSQHRPWIAGSRRQSALQTLGLRKKSDIEIVLDGPEEFVHTYSSFDQIKGQVKLKFEKDTSIDDISVTFEGLSQTYVEKVATTAPTTGRTTGKHHFLKLLQPIEAQDLPENRLARAGETCSIPFTFVVPDRLLPQICSHTTESGEVTRAHVQLPPSLGDAAVAGDGQTLCDDLAPDMSKVTYCVRVRIAKRSPTGRSVDIVDRSLKVRIVPGKDEEPPINVEEGEADYILRKEKSVKRGLFKVGKIGRLVAETSQPRSLRLLHPSKRSAQPITTMTAINLRFDPLDADAHPPQISSCTTRLRSYTFFGAAPYRGIPGASDQDKWSSLHGLYPDTVELSSRNLSTVTWTKHDPNEPELSLARRPSTFSDMSFNSVPEPTATYAAGSPFWTASVLVPISLPTDCKKTFVPSFHSCIISRSYTLELNLHYSSPGTSVGTSSLILKSPIQISSEGGIPPEGIEESEAALAAEIERQFFEFENRQLSDAEAAVNGESEPGTVVTNGATPYLPLARLATSLPLNTSDLPSPEYTESPLYSFIAPPVRQHVANAANDAEIPAYSASPTTTAQPISSTTHNSNIANATISPSSTRYMSATENYTPSYTPVPPPEYHSGAGGRVRGGITPRVRTQSVSLHAQPSNRVQTSVRWRVGGSFHD